MANARIAMSGSIGVSELKNHYGRKTMITKKSIIELGQAEGYNAQEFMDELLESVAALGMMALDKKNKKENAKHTKITWTLMCDDDVKYEIAISKIV